MEIAKREYKDQVYDDVLNRSPEVMEPHRYRHERSRQHVRNRRSEYTINSGTRPSSWINDLFGWIKSSVSGLLGSKPEETSSTPNPISQVDARMDVNGTIILLDLLVKKVTGQKYVSSVESSISLLEAQDYALNIIEEFEKALNETATKSGISVTNLNFDSVKTQLAILEQIINGMFSKISKTLYSSAKEACPEFQQTDKFLVDLKSYLEGKKETALLQQKVENPSKIMDQKILER